MIEAASEGSAGPCRAELHAEEEGYPSCGRIDESWKTGAMKLILTIGVGNVLQLAHLE